jgi:hypothetical protein
MSGMKRCLLRAAVTGALLTYVSCPHSLHLHANLLLGPYRQYADFHKFLYDTAVKNGVEIRLNCRVGGFDEEEGEYVTLASGEKVHGDVIVAAAGAEGCVIRAAMLEEEGLGSACKSGLRNWKYVIAIDVE